MLSFAVDLIFLVFFSLSLPVGQSPRVKSVAVRERRGRSPPPLIWRDGRRMKRDDAGVVF